MFISAKETAPPHSKYDTGQSKLFERKATHGLSAEFVFRFFECGGAVSLAEININ